MDLSIHIPKFFVDVLRTILPDAYIDWWVRLLHENPTHLYIETTLIFVIIFILTRSPNKKTGRRHEVAADVLQERLNNFHPEPLAPTNLSEESRMVLNDMVIVESAPSAAKITVSSKNTSGNRTTPDVVNFGSADFLDFGSSEEVRKSTEDALNKYGVGSCGPRGFYGTIDAHVKIEEAIAKFFKKSEAIIYSDGASTTCSAIPAFANRNDILVVDDGCNDNIFTGVRLSRASLKLFKHNDMVDLERILKEIDQEDIRLNRKATSRRRFIIFEGLYRNFGDIAPLPKIVELKMKYKWRLIADESLSFGVLGKSGKGVTEYFNCDDDSVEILIGSLETTLASVGGFCVGTQEVVEHQRLNGAGYCFSASAPPFTCTAAQAALELLDCEAGRKKLQLLKEKCQKFVKLLEADSNLRILSASESPVVHIQLTKTFDSHLDEIKTLRKISSQLLDQEKLLVIPTYYPDAASSTTKNTLRLYLHVEHTETDLKRTADALKSVVAQSV